MAAIEHGSLIIVADQEFFDNQYVWHLLNCIRACQGTPPLNATLNQHGPIDYEVSATEVYITGEQWGSSVNDFRAVASKYNRQHPASSVVFITREAPADDGFVFGVNYLAYHHIDSDWQPFAICPIGTDVQGYDELQLLTYAFTHEVWEMLCDPMCDGIEVADPCSYTKPLTCGSYSYDVCSLIDNNGVCW